MARIRLLAPEEMTPAQLAQYERFPANLIRGAVHAGPIAEHYLSTGASFRMARLSARHRELVILRVGVLSNCAYERMQHLPIAAAAGWSADEIAAIEQGNQTALDSVSAALLRFVDECVYRVKVTPETFAALRAELTEQEIVETTMLIGHYMMTARILETLEIDLDAKPTSWDKLSIAAI